jgi:error-prone DNA polymerase
VGEDDTLRLGLCFVRGLSRSEGERIITERKSRPFDSLTDFQLRSALGKPALRALAKIGALNSFAEHRRAVQWHVEVSRELDDLFASAEARTAPPLEPMSDAERLRADYAGTSLTTGPHPMALVRGKSPHLWTAADLPLARNGERITIGGMVICRQRPGTAKGFVFVSLEDETGVTNAIVTPQLYEKCRLTIGEETFLEIEGFVQNADDVIHLKALRVSPLKNAPSVFARSHDFR